MDRFLKRWSVRSLLLVGLVLAVPLGHASAQTAPAGVSVLAQEEPMDEDQGPSNEAVGPEDMGDTSGADLSPLEATGPDQKDPNGVSVPVSSTPEGGGNEGP